MQPDVPTPGSNTAPDMEKPAPDGVPATSDTVELRASAHDTVSDLIPEADLNQPPKHDYRDAAGGWRVWH